MHPFDEKIQNVTRNVSIILVYQYKVNLAAIRDRNIPLMYNMFEMYWDDTANRNFLELEY